MRKTFVKTAVTLNNLFLVEDMIKEVDVDGDGKIDFYEFVHALGEPEDSQDIEEEDEFINSPLPTPKSIDPSFGDVLSQWFTHNMPSANE